MQLQEMLKLFNDSNFFYYSDTYDLTNTVQRQNSVGYPKELLPWQRADQRFFWNMNLVTELMENSVSFDMCVCCIVMRQHVTER